MQDNLFAEFHFGLSRVYKYIYRTPGSFRMLDVNMA